jgi:hypothetical protein
MRIETALKKRDRAYTRLWDLFDIARHCRMPSADIQMRYQTITQDMGKAPAWCSDYLKGAYKVLTDKLYRYDLEYCSICPNGEIVSHNSKSDRYYQKKNRRSYEVSANWEPFKTYTY